MNREAHDYFYVYMLKCSDGSYYIGHTDNLAMRLAEHKSSKYKGYTAKRLPVELVYHEAFESREDAFVAERKIKKWTRNKKEALVAENWSKISQLAKKIF